MNDPTRTCACGCGTPVTNKWARGHAARGEGGYAGSAAIPPPDDPWWEEDSGGPHEDIGVIDPADARALADAIHDTLPPEPGPGYEPGPSQPDPPPAHGRKQWRKETKPTARPTAAVRVTAGVRKDVNAKLSILLGVPGSVWQARDPLCGGTFMEELPNISAAFANFVCESPDLLEWFVGSGGRFMLVLDILASLMPIGTVVMAHHVYHSVEIGAPDEQADAPRYAA
jgi:hypothetical protein